MPKNSNSPLNGLLVINKPTGPTSHDIVRQVRRLAGLPAVLAGQNTRVGHAGTLDPFATGVLLVLLGNANRLMEYIHLLPKTYLATLTLGATSTTQDPTGTITPLATSDKPDIKTVRSALKKFIGRQTQTPPIFSAVKFQGKKLYQIARQAGEAGEGSAALQAAKARPRQVIIHHLTILEYSFPTLKISVTCGSGTYIRTLAQDIGEVLGTGAYLTALHRESIGTFHSRHAKKPDEITPQNLPKLLLPSKQAVSHLPHITLPATSVAQLQQGKAVAVKHAQNYPPNKPLTLIDENSDFFGIGAIKGTPPLLYPNKIFSN